MYWLEVSVLVDGEAAEAVSEALRPFAYNEGVVLEQMGDEDSPDPTALEPEVAVKIYLPAAADNPAVRRQIEEKLYFLGRLYPIPAPDFRQLEEQDWANAWKEHYHPFRVGRRLWVQPSWAEAAEAKEEGSVSLTLDPGMAFGTGLHPTTQSCLQALERLVKPGMSLLDVGAGSGILAIAAAKLGAVEVWAVDNDEVAVAAAAANAERNGVLDRVNVFQGTLLDVRRNNWDLVAVNILAPVIESLLREHGLLDFVAEDGRLILSGIIEEQAAGVTAAVAAGGGIVAETLTIRDWVSLIVRRA